MSLGWLQQRERGSRLAYEFMVWVALRLGRSVGRGLLYPICAYYTLFSQRASTGSRSFLEKALGRRVNTRDLFQHNHCFASTLLDRVYLLAGQNNRFEIAQHGDGCVLEKVDRGQGCILLGSHLGSFEIVRAFGSTRRELLVKILMDEENAPIITRVLTKLNPDIANTVIPARLPHTMLQVKDCLDKGGLVGILGDRTIPSHKVVSCKFFGDLTHFPAGPMLLASILNVPVFLFFGLYRGGRRYDIYFELLAERIVIDRQERMRDIQMWTQRYAERLEWYCRLAPYNWFNFYDYWNERS